MQIKWLSHIVVDVMYNFEHLEQIRHGFELCFSPCNQDFMGSFLP